VTRISPTSRHQHRPNNHGDHEFQAPRARQHTPSGVRPAARLAWAVLPPVASELCVAAFRRVCLCRDPR